jgi:hypothetical protein
VRHHEGVEHHAGPRRRIQTADGKRTRADRAAGRDLPAAACSVICRGPAARTWHSAYPSTASLYSASAGESVAS